MSILNREGSYAAFFFLVAVFFLATGAFFFLATAFFFAAGFLALVLGAAAFFLETAMLISLVFVWFDNQATYKQSIGDHDAKLKKKEMLV